MPQAPKAHQQHPLSAAFPAMPADDFAALVEDIRKHGQRDVATLYDGMVIDGWHRYQACQEIGIPCRFEPFQGDDPAAFVISRNRHRRHLTETQRAAAVVAVHRWRPANEAGKPAASGKGDPGLPSGGKGIPGYPSATVRQMAAEAGVDRQTIQRAKQAHAAGLGEAMRDGKVTAKAAAEVAKVPEVAQQVAAGKVEPAAAVQAVRAAKPKPAAAPAPVAPVAPAPARDDAGPDLAELVDELQAENERLTAEIAAASADDLKAEAIKWRRCYEQAVRQQSEAMAAARRAEQREGVAMRALMRCGKAVGVDDPRKIAAAVEAAMKQALAA